MKQYESIPAEIVSAFKVEFPEDATEETKVEGYPVQLTMQGVPYITVMTNSGKKHVGNGVYVVESSDGRVTMTEKEFTSKYREVDVV